jgi:hypothetical protein
MQRFKLGFRNKSALEQLVICEKVVAGFVNLSEEQQARPDYVEATATVAALRASHLRVQSLRAELAAEIKNRKDLLRAARNRVTGSALGISLHVNADPAKLLASGLDLAAPTTIRYGRCAAPENLRAETHALDGVVKLRWEHSLRRAVFAIEYRAESSDEKDWKQYEICARRSCMVKGLTSGVKYLFRVNAYNAHGPGPWCNWVSARVR